MRINPAAFCQSLFNKSSSRWCPVYLFDEDVASLDGLDEKFDCGTLPFSLRVILAESVNDVTEPKDLTLI